MCDATPGADADAPRVSIGLPVFNGERYLESAIESILGQRFTDFELIISDNGSSDRTPEICRRYASRDARIRFTRSSANRGAAWNFCHVFDLARGEYFKWAAHDDILAPEYLGACVSRLDADPTLIACQSGTRRIDADGNHCGLYTESVSAPDPCERFRRAVDAVYPFELFGVIRAAVLRETCLIGPNPQSDIDLLQDLVLRGDIGRVPEVLFARRSHPDSYTEGTTSFRAGLEWMDPSRDVSYATYCVSRFWRLNAQVLRAPLGWSARLRCIGLLFARTFRELRRRARGLPIERSGSQPSMRYGRSTIDSRSSGSRACS